KPSEHTPKDKVLYLRTRSNRSAHTQCGRSAALIGIPLRAPHARSRKLVQVKSGNSDKKKRPPVPPKRNRVWRFTAGYRLLGQSLAVVLAAGGPLAFAELLRQQVLGRRYRLFQIAAAAAVDTGSNVVVVEFHPKRRFAAMTGYRELNQPELAVAAP